MLPPLKGWKIPFQGHLGCLEKLQRYPLEKENFKRWAQRREENGKRTREISPNNIKLFLGKG